MEVILSLLGIFPDFIKVLFLVSSWKELHGSFVGGRLKHEITWSSFGFRLRMGFELTIKKGLSGILIGFLGFKLGKEVRSRF